MHGHLDSCVQLPHSFGTDHVTVIACHTVSLDGSGAAEVIVGNDHLVAHHVSARTGCGGLQVVDEEDRLYVLALEFDIETQGRLCCIPA